MRKGVGAPKGKLQLRMGGPGLFFHARISALLRVRNELPESSVLDPISAPGAVRKRPGSEKVDIEFTSIFAYSSAPWRLGSGTKMTPGSNLEGAPL